MKTDVYFARKDDFGLIAYENGIKQNIFMQIAAVDYAPQVNEIIICDAKYDIKELIEKYYEFEIREKKKLDIGWKYKHIWKPLMNIHIERELDITQSELFHAKRDLGILIQKLQEILLFIEPSEDGLKAYSHKIRELLFLACSDLESTFKKYKFGKNERMNNYIEILKFVDLTKYKISLVGYAKPYKCSPFEKWNEKEPAKSLDWYDAYNKIKHNREDNFHFATLENCINAIAANLIMFAVRFSPTTLYNENDVCSNLARSALEYKIENSKDFYIPVFEGEGKYFDTYMSCRFKNGKVLPDIYKTYHVLPYEERPLK